MQVIPIDFWPLTRDCLAYGISVILLILVINDEVVSWWEALILFAAYFIYVVGKSFLNPFIFFFLLFILLSFTMLRSISSVLLFLLQ